MNSILDMLKPVLDAKATIALVKEGLPTGSELYSAVRGKSDAYLKTYLRTIQKELERLNNASH